MIQIYDRVLSSRSVPTLAALVAEPPRRAGKFGQETLQPFRDPEAIRAFVSGPGLVAFRDMPWLRIYLNC